MPYSHTDQIGKWWDFGCLDDFYMAHQTTIDMRDASRQAHVYSELDQNIQNLFNERNLEYYPKL